MARKRMQPSLDLIGFESSEDIHIPLNRARITESAVRLLNSLGLKELSMRKVADDLKVQPASLYYHVNGKDQLLQLIADQISSEMAAPDASLPWKEQILQWSEQFRKALLAYRDSVELFNSTIALGYNRLLQIEKLFHIFAAAGFQDNHIPWMASMLKSYVLGFAAEEARLSSRTGPGDTESEPMNQQYNHLYRKLPKEEFPNMIRLASYVTNTDWQKEFHFGIRVLIDGFSAKLPPSGNQ